MIKSISAFAVVKKAGKNAGEEGAREPSFDPPGGAGDDPRTEAALAAMEGEFANVDENDPRAMGRMMRRMAEATGRRSTARWRRSSASWRRGPTRRHWRSGSGEEMPGSGEGWRVAGP